MTGHQYCSGRLGPEPTAPAPGLPAPRPGHWLRQPRPAEPGACAEPAQVPEAGCRWRPPPRPGPGSHGRGPRESLRWGDGVRTKRGDQGHTDVGDCERAEGAGVAETGTGRGPDEGAHPHGHAGPRPRPAPATAYAPSPRATGFTFYVGKDIRVSGGPSRPGSARGRPASRPAGGAASWPGQHGRPRSPGGSEARAWLGAGDVCVPAPWAAPLQP